MGEFTRRRPQPGTTVPAAELPTDPKFTERYPALWDNLTTGRDEAGKPRETMTLLVFVQEGVWKGCINDRQNHESCFVTGTTFEALIKAVEATLAQGKGDWRQWKGRK